MTEMRNGMTAVPLENAEIAAILSQAQKFWFKWRERVLEKDFDDWEEVIKDAGDIMKNHGTRFVRKWEGPTPTMEEESVTAPIVNWFLDQLEARSRKGEK